MILKVLPIVFSVGCLWIPLGDARSDANPKKNTKLTCYNGYEDGSGSVNGTMECQIGSGCAIFASQNPNSTTSDIVSINYFCDGTNICKSRKGFEKNVKLDKTPGDLFCCHGDRCNTRDKMPSKLTMEHTCFRGTAELNGTKAYNITGALSVCKSQVCISEREFLGALNPNFVVYDCDYANNCQNISNTCVNLTQPNHSIIDRCCCSSSACNKPATILPPHMTTDVPVMVAMPHSLLPKHKQSSFYIIGGVAAAGLFSVLLLIIVIVIVRWFQRRQQEHFSYIYSQLTADLSEELDDKDDDARMLVP